VLEAFAVSHGRTAGRGEPGWWKCPIIFSCGKADRRVRGGEAGSSVKSAVVTGRERSCTAFAREQRWSETNLKSNEGVEEPDGEDAEGVETSGGITTGGAEEDHRIHLGT
jgi:hypothetical protein